MGKNYLDARSVLSAEDFQYADVDCPEWGGPVRVRGLTAGERSYIARKIKENNQQDLEVSVVIYGTVDENGDRLFSKTDRDQLKQKSNNVINRIAKRILELSGGDEDSAAETQKNSD
jgi:hypothetical protein